MTTCVSCFGKYQKPEEEVKYTFRKGKRLPLCLTCWAAALQIQNTLKVGNRAEDARKRYEMKRLLGKG